LKIETPLLVIGNFSLAEQMICGQIERIGWLAGFLVGYCSHWWKISYSFFKGF